MSKANQLTIASKPGELYRRMQASIAACYSVDDCTDIAKQASGVAAYFKQINDDESVWKFLAVKLRAWRRIGEILLQVDNADCETVAAHIRKIKKNFADDPCVPTMSDSAIANALRLGRLPIDFFEREVGRQPSISAMLNAYRHFTEKEWEASPAGQAELKRREERSKQSAAEHEQWVDEQAKRIQEANEQAAALNAEREKQNKQIALDHAAMKAAREEVGYTMDRRDRENMKEVLFIIKAQVHATLRQAAFDNRMTMQAVLRAGLAMWLLANGYPVDPDDMPPGRRATPQRKEARP